MKRMTDVRNFKLQASSSLGLISVGLSDVSPSVVEPSGTSTRGMEEVEAKQKQ